MIPPEERDRIAAMERRAEGLEEEAGALLAEARTCRARAERIRRYYLQMVAVFGAEAVIAHARREWTNPIIEVP
ncbi:hypothetical protein [Methanofollis fontis]|uniref:hypothetical protein n=1 Tax=Methanofollis fontis TaxID=2052832 RepID=UPI00102EF465|nr:hypothetical protein [Methanofollis fontis]